MSATLIVVLLFIAFCLSLAAAIYCLSFDNIDASFISFMCFLLAFIIFIAGAIYVSKQ